MTHFRPNKTVAATFLVFSSFFLLDLTFFSQCYLVLSRLDFGLTFFSDYCLVFLEIPSIALLDRCSPELLPAAMECEWKLNISTEFYRVVPCFSSCRSFFAIFQFFFLSFLIPSMPTEVRPFRPIGDYGYLVLPSCSVQSIPPLPPPPLIGCTVPVTGGKRSELFGLFLQPKKRWWRHRWRHRWRCCWGWFFLDAIRRIGRF